MDQIRWQQIGTIVDQALSFDTPEERKALVEQLCGDNEVLKAEVIDWLNSIADSKGLWDELLLSNRVLMDDMTLGDAPPLQKSPQKLPEKIGLYKIKRRLGRGGMGDVYLAERTEGDFHKKVALKVIREEVSSTEQVRRFLQERTLLSRLNHPNIARLLDGGVSGDGRPYYVMEHVEGVPITEYCKQQDCSINERLTLFGQVCQSVQYAHSNFIVHRDLKPDNLLVNGEGNVKVLDFGIAKLMDQELGEKTLLQTRSGQRMLSLHYAAPEQITMQPITAATDVYTLGLLLYELLTESRPFELTGKRLLEAEQIIRDQEPAKPSIATEIWQEKLADDLDAIILKTLRKEPEQRYESASRLWEDVERYLESRPVLARKDTLRYRADKFVRRHKTGLAVSAIVFILIAGLSGFYTWKIAQERDQANLEAQKAEQTAQFLTGLFSQADPQRAQEAEITAREILDTGAEKIVAQLVNQPKVQAKVLSVMGQAYYNINLLNKADTLVSKALEIYEKFESMQFSNDFAYTQWVMANIRSSLGNYDDAEKRMRSALAIYRENEGENATETKQCVLDLSIILHERRKFDKSNKKLDDWSSKHPDENSAELATRLINEGEIAYVRKNFKESEEKTRKALSIRLQIYGENHAFTAIAMDRLSGTLSLEKYCNAEAERLQEKAVAINNSVYDEPHAEWAFSIFKLGKLKKICGQYNEAKKLYLQAISMMEKVHGSNSLYTLNIRLKYAHLLLEMNDVDTARGMYKELELLFNDKYGRDHLFSIKSRERLAYILEEENKLNEAAQLFRTVISEYDRKYGKIHFNSMSSRIHYGCILAELGNLKEAEQWILESLNFLLDSKTDVKLRLAIAERSLGLLRMKQNQFYEAERLIRNSYNLLKEKRGPKSSFTKKSLEAHITLYEQWDKPDKVQEYQTLIVKSQS